VRTVPLYGEKAAGRVALVDDEDYDLVMAYRWNVWEPEPKPGHRQNGPYAVTSSGLRMHMLLTGWPLTDHANHDTLDNQRHNLRPATYAQNQWNRLPRLDCSSQYKGVCLVRDGLWWRAYIDRDGQRRWLGDFASELEAAYAYDAAARELFGEYAYPNFSEGPTRTMRAQWRAARETLKALMAAEHVHACSVGGTTTWQRRQPETRTCEGCGAEYQSRSTNSRWCGYRCRKLASLPAEAERKRRIREREREQRQFEPIACGECGSEFQPKRENHLYCKRECKDAANLRRRQEQRAAAAKLEGKLF